MNTTLPLMSDPPRSYRMELPAAGGWITLNQRGRHWGQKARLTAHWRHLGHTASIHYALPRMKLAHVVAELRFTDKRRRDAHNWMPTAKAVIDGMVDAGIFPDDSYQYVIGPDMRIGPVVPAPSLVVHVFPGRP